MGRPEEFVLLQFLNDLHFITQTLYKIISCLLKIKTVYYYNTTIM